nr:hypothetical protein [Tanacetum cinerariifolium]
RVQHVVERAGQREVAVVEVVVRKLVGVEVGVVADESAPALMGGEVAPGLLAGRVGQPVHEGGAGLVLERGGGLVVQLLGQQRKF